MREYYCNRCNQNLDEDFEICPVCGCEGITEIDIDEVAERR